MKSLTKLLISTAITSAMAACGGGGSGGETPSGAVVATPTATPSPTPTPAPSPAPTPASAALIVPADTKLAWNFESSLQVTLTDPQGKLVTPITCKPSDATTVAVTTDCTKATLLRLGAQSIVVSGGTYSATLALQGVPQRTWSGQHGVASSFGAGSYNLIALSDGSTRSWGGNPFGVLGQNNGLTTSFSNLLVPILNSAGNAPLDQIYQISAGTVNAFALSEDGSVWGWGRNASCNLAQAVCGNPVLLPVRVRNTSNTGILTNVVQAEAGGGNQVALIDNGSVMTWGDYAGQGDSNSGNKNFPGLVKTPDGSAALSNIVSIAAGEAFSLALSKDGKVYAWGYDLSQGRLGSGTTFNTPSALANVVKKQDGSELTNITSISAGYNFSLALASDGSVWSWGDNSFAQLGQNTQSYSGVPYAVQIKAPLGTTGLLGNIVMVAAGGNHALALDKAGKVFAWGLATSGQLGDSANRTAGNQSLLPRAVVGTDGVSALSSVASISAGYDSNTVLQADGSVLMWGDNFRGVLGRGELAGAGVPNSPVPAAVVINAAKTPLKITSLAAYPNLLRHAR